MKATPPARALAWSVEFLDRFWAPIVFAIVVVLEITLFVPRQNFVGMIVCACVGAAALVTWIGNGARRL